MKYSHNYNKLHKYNKINIKKKMTTTFIPIPVRSKSKLFFLANEEPELAEHTKN